MILSGQSTWKGFVRASLQAAESAGSGLLWLRISRKFDGNEILVGFGKSFKSSSWIFTRRSDAEVLCQILRARSGTAGGRVYALSFLPASQERLVVGKSPMQ